MKHKYPAPEWRSIIAMLGVPLDRQMRLAVVTVPEFAKNAARVSVELQVMRPSGHWAVFKRWGELVPNCTGERYQAAVMRAAMEAHSFCDGKDADELALLALWETDTKRLQP